MIRYKGQLYRQAGNPLPQKLLLTVDPQIRSLIARINLLPFVETTKHSCAGYGKSIGLVLAGPHIGTTHRSDAHPPGKRAYVVIQYRGEDWRSFHEDLTNVVEHAYDAHVEHPAHHSPNTHSYVVVEMHNLSHDGKDSPSPAYYARAWKKVRAVVDKYAKLHGVYHEKRKAKEEEKEKGR